jgi:hypothetical protein
MKRGVSALLVGLVLPWIGRAGEDAPGQEPHGRTAASVDAAPVVVTINPEGRVSAALGSPLPSPVPWDTPVELAVKIVNQGFVTGHLEAQLVGDPKPRVRLDFPDDALKGVPQETRTLRLTLLKATPTDLTIAFRMRRDVPSPAGRDRVHFVLRGQ